MTAPLQSPRFAAYDNAGGPLVGGLLYTMASGSTTPKAAFTDAALSIAHTTNPIVLNARGEASVWLGPGAYRLRLTDSNDRVLWDVDGVTGPEALGTAQTLTDALRAALAGGGVTQGASMVALRDPSSKWAAVNLEDLAGEVDSRLSTLAIAQAGHGARISTAEGELVEHEGRIVALEAVPRTSGVFTPTLDGFGESGTISTSGRWVRNDKAVHWSITIDATEGGLSSLWGTSFVDGLPFTPAVPSACCVVFASGAQTAGALLTTAGRIQMPYFTAGAHHVTVSGVAIIA